jgi:hypothetical protein
MMPLFGADTRYQQLYRPVHTDGSSGTIYGYHFVLYRADRSLYMAGPSSSAISTWMSLLYRHISVENYLSFCDDCRAVPSDQVVSILSDGEESLRFTSDCLLFGELQALCALLALPRMGDETVDLNRNRSLTQASTPVGGASNNNDEELPNETGRSDGYPPASSRSHTRSQHSDARVTRSSDASDWNEAELTPDWIRDESLIVLLRSLDLSHFEVGDGAVALLGALLAQRGTLLQLILAHNCLTERGIFFLCRALYLNVTLVSLDLSHNKMGDAGARHLGDLLLSNTVLEELDIAANGIGPQGAAALANALVDGFCLKLNLSENPLGDEGLRCLSEGIQTTSRLQVLKLDATEIHGDGIRALSQAIARNMSLQHLSLRRNACHESSLASLAAHVRLAKELKYVDLSENDTLNESGMAALGGLLEAGLKLSALTLSLPSDNKVDG